MNAVEPLSAISCALSDSNRLIRVGAAKAAPWLAPIGSRLLLTKRADQLDDPLDAGETSILLVALARSGGDPFPLAARLMKDSADNVRASVSEDYGRWAEYANARAKIVSLQGSIKPLGYFFASCKMRERGNELRQVASSPDLASRRISNALSDFQFWSNAASGDADTDLARLINSSFDAALTNLRQSEIGNAVELLVDLVLTAQNEWVRLIAQYMLPSLKTDASASLLSILGTSSDMPVDPNLQSAIEKDSRESLSSELKRDELEAFLAGESLERFTDISTAFAVVNAAITWPMRVRARAMRVAARMSANVALPPMVWIAKHSPIAKERVSAQNLLRGIVTKDPAFGIRQHHVDVSEFESGQLEWLLEIVFDGTSARGWTSDPSACVNILGSAIEAIPEIGRELNYSYSVPPTGMLANAFLRSISTLRRLLNADPLPSVTQARHPRVEFPASCTSGAHETLSVQLLLSQESTGSAPINVEFKRAEDVVELLVFVRAPGFSIAMDQKTIRVPRDQSSEIATFDLVAVGSGDQAIDIKFFYGTSIIGHCCVQTKIAPRERTGTASTVPLNLFDVETDLLRDVAQAVFLVKVGYGGKLNWRLLRSHSEPLDLGFSPLAFGRAEADAWAGKQGVLVRQILEEELSQPDQASVMAQLAAIGNALFAQIAPPALKASLEKLQENAIVVIDSDAEWIPWELLASAPQEKMWGEKFVIVRAPCMTKPPNATIAQPTEVSPHLGRALLVVGDKVSEPRRLLNRTFGGMAKRIEPSLIEPHWRDLCAAVSGKDIIHFICHGRSDPVYHLSYCQGVGGRLYPRQAHQLGLKWGAVVFANACSSGQADLLLTDFESFGREFYYAGARPFIGTLGPVPQNDAVEFASIFYEQFAFAGLPVGQAMRRAKEESALRLSRPVWLFYSLYGNPSVVRRWSADASLL